MNTKQCVYRNCGNTSEFSKVTFFGFPLKDQEKCQLWTRMAGCEDLPSLKNKFLCENHFSSIYFSKTPRRTVVLPNAVPFQWDENINKEESYDEEYTSEKNTSREEMLLDPLDEANDIIYTDTIEMMRHTDTATDEHVEALDDVIVEEEIPNANAKVKTNATKATKSVQKTYDPIGNRGKKVTEKIPVNRMSLPSGGDFVNHVTKRQKLARCASSNDSPLKVEQKPDVGAAKEVEQEEEDKTTQIDNTIDNPDITTFIYKGEEYIQMPKRTYLQERAKLDAEAKRYRRIVHNIKGLVNATD